mgnify:CR=1 FL=1
MVFAYKKPSPGYFISKLKDIEYTFRGDYLSNCLGKKKKKNNFEQNPLENLSLPFQEILALCSTKVKETGYNLRNLMKDEEFCFKVEELVNNFLQLIEFDHLTHYKEQDAFRKNIYDENEDGDKDSPINEEQNFGEEEEPFQAEEEEFKDENEDEVMENEIKQDYFSIPKLDSNDKELKITKYSKIQINEETLNLIAY